MNRYLALLVLLVTFAAPVRAEDDDADAQEAPALGGPKAAQRVNFIPMKPTRARGGAADAGAASGGKAGDPKGAEGPTDPSIAYLQKVKIKLVLDKHADFTRKQMSYGVFEIDGSYQGIAVGFRTGQRAGMMQGHYCNVVGAATSASGCGWTSWITDTPGGRPLCATLPDGNGASSPQAWVVGKEAPFEKLKELVKKSGVSKLGRDVCALKPHKTYYCQMTAQAWDGDKWVLDRKPGWNVQTNGQTCTGLKASSPYDTFEAADSMMASHPVGM